MFNGKRIQETVLRLVFLSSKALFVRAMLVFSIESM